ncbi:MAG TPA: sulfate/thiosulfate ABC transporter permease CysW, partial [Burkholderiales bacterium]|nr:sulfate/thiosulfate ABC transporter permease CysW [Burkholderiales bacterium]
MVELAPSFGSSNRRAALSLPLTEPRAARFALMTIALGFVAVFLILPLLVVFAEALRLGLRAYVTAILQPEAIAAIRLTVLTALIVVPLNAIFGIAAAWMVTKYRVRGKNLLLTLIDMPFSV